MELGQILLNLLVFVFGYFTCHTFYFFKSIRRSIALLKLSQIVSLSILLKCIEEYSGAATHKLLALNNCGIIDSDPVYIKVTNESETIIEDFKIRSIESIKAMHTGFFEPTVSFEDWNSAMHFLNENREVVNKFFKDGK
jgi:hypothetical protein